MNLKWVMFIVPVIAVLLIIVLYFILLKREPDKIVFKKFVLNTGIVSFILNFAWELIQMPLYKNKVYDVQHIYFCALATVADTIMVLLIYFSFALIYKNAFWIKNINIQKALLLMLTGGVGAILAEMKHLAEGNWAYASSMPVLPFVNAGLSPVLQFMLLPLLIYYVSFLFLSRVKKSRLDF